MEAGRTAAWGLAAAEGGALGLAGEAIGEVDVDETGTPQVDCERERERGESGIVSVRMRYGQLQQAEQEGAEVKAAEWNGDAGAWLRACALLRACACVGMGHRHVFVS